MKYMSALMVMCILFLSACGEAQPTATPAAPAAPATDLSAIKTYLLEKTTQLETDTTALETAAQQYYDLAAAQNFDYAKLWSADSAAVSKAINDARTAWLAASPRYEQVEGIVAGVPVLSQFDVELDAGASGEEGGDSVVSFDLQLADGRTLSKPGNLFGVTESTLWGTFDAFSVPEVEADLNGDGTLEFGERLPEAHVLLAAAKKLRTTSSELLAASNQWEPKVDEAFNALVVMIPTMSEYFDSWKNSRFVAGEATDQRDFVAISRLSDVQDILGSLQVVYTSVEPLIAAKDPTQAAKIRTDLADLKSFVAGVYAEEQGGKRFTAEQADLLGAEAQERATGITGSISQMAALLNISISQ